MKGQSERVRFGEAFSDEEDTLADGERMAPFEPGAFVAEDGKEK